MKRFLLYLLALAPLSAFATLPPSGYYRVQNTGTGRYMSIVDINASYDKVSNVADLKAIYMLDDFESLVAFNAATICYFDAINGQYNISGQGLNLYNATGGYLFNIEEKDGVYQIFATAYGAVKYLSDNRNHGYNTWPNLDGKDRNWNILPVDLSDGQYFGVKPDITASADGSYWATLYAGFPFKPSAADTKVYTVSKVDNANGYAVIKEVTGNVPPQAPVLFRCGAATASGNKMTLLDPSTTASLGTNYLNGNYYCNNVTTNHRNVTAYNSTTMRMLGTTSDGKPAFVKSNISYLPANKSYLAVSSSAPDVLKIVTEAEYEEITGIEELNFSGADAPKKIYDLQGRRVTAPTKGLYIVNGKKVVIK